MNMCQRIAALVSILSFTSVPESIAGSVNGLSVWSRGLGSFNDGAEPMRIRSVRLELEALKQVRRSMNDVQYERKETYVGLPLRSVLKLYTPSNHDDMAILHFENGMLIPVPLDDSTLTRLDAFVALQICSSSTTCDNSFREIERESIFSSSPDPRPIKFSWNKIVVPTPWHPDVPGERAKIFSPWRHVDSLSGIEFVNEVAYRRQFALGDEVGEQVFAARCQYCHGVRQVGATFGWDFVTPLPIYEKRGPDNLLNHVKYPKALAFKMGLLMPVQKDVTETEIQALWRWMKRAAHRPIRPYRP